MPHRYRALRRMCALTKEGNSTGGLEVYANADGLKELRELGFGGGSSPDKGLAGSPASLGAADPGLQELRELGFGDSKAKSDTSLSELKELFPDSGKPSGARNLDREPLGPNDSDANTSGLISKVQTLLEQNGYILSQHGRDGKYGKETESAIKEFQGNNEISGPIVGKVDEKTFKLLSSHNAVKRKLNLDSSDSISQKSQGRPEEGVASAGGPNKISASQFYADLMAGINKPNLCKAMVANAIAESGLRVNVNGDCGSYAKKKGSLAIDTSLYPDIFYKPSRGGCCSFGLWQYNICGGLGNALLKAYGVGKDSSDKEKIAVLTSYKKQLDFMISHVKRRAPLSKQKSVDDWVDWFVRKVERPAKMDLAVVKRQKIARGLNFA